MTIQGPDRRLLLSTTILGALCLLAYCNSFYPQFQYDDIRLIRFNFSLRDLTQWKTILAFEFFRPITLLSFAFNFQISQKDPFSYHVVNLVLHIVNVLLFYLLLRRSIASAIFCFLASALMAVHPLNTESVTYLASRSILLCAFFSLLALHQFDSYVRRSRWKNAIGFFLLFLLAIGSKEEGWILLPAVLLYEWVLFGFDTLKRHKCFHCIAFLLFGTAGMLRVILHWKWSAMALAPLHIYLATEITVWLRYIALAFYPVSLNVDHSVAALTWHNPTAWLSLLVVVGILAVLWKIRLRVPILCFWGYWFFLTLLPSSVIPLNDFMAEHRTYLSMLGFCTVLAFPVVAFHKNGKPSSLIAGALVIQLLFYLGATVQRNQIWHDELTLWGDSVKKSPEKPRPRLNYAGALLRSYAADEALQQYYIARSLSPRLPAVYSGLGSCFLTKGQIEEAETNFKKALELDPGLADAQAGLGIVFYLKQRFAEALPYFETVYPQRRESIDLIRMMAESYLQTQQYEKAMNLLQKGSEMEPANPYWNMKLDVVERLSKEKGGS